MFIVGANEWVIPSPHVPPGSDDEIRERCLLYVAASRGRDTLTIMSPGRPSEFIQEPQ
jgi:superfamily I DNA/RNA helicase